MTTLPNVIPFALSLRFWLDKHFAFARTQFVQARTAFAVFEVASLTALRTASNATVPGSGGISVSRARGVHGTENDLIFLLRPDYDVNSNAPAAWRMTQEREGESEKHAVGFGATELRSSIF